MRATVIANVFGYTTKEYEETIRVLNEGEGIAAYELNVSCPNTKHGGIKLTWEASGPAAERWMLCVQDSGPGVGTPATTPLSSALDTATRDAQNTQPAPATRGETQPAPAPTLASRVAHESERPGEGIGLAIVKRLCELLDAALELQTEPGRGSTFRVTFPSRYTKG